MTEFIFPLRVYIEDTDYLGMVYHANYLKYFERARSEWIEQIGLGTEWQKENEVFFAVYFAQLDFIKPGRVHQELEVVSRISEMKGASASYDQFIRLKSSPDTILCKGDIKIVCIDKNFKPRAIPKFFVQTIRG